MKILIIGNSASGTYQFRKELLETLINNGNEVFLSVPSDGDNDEFVKKIEKFGCKVIITEMDRRGMNPVAEQKLFRFYCKIIRDIKPDKVLTYTVKPNIYGGIAAKKYGVPQIANITGLGTVIEGGGRKAKAMLHLYKRGLANAQVVFFQNRANHDIFCNQLHIVLGRTIIIPGSGVNLSTHPFESYPKESNELVLLVIGRIMKDKGIDEILDAARIIKEDHPKVFIKLIGSFDGNYCERIKCAEKDGIVEYLGSQNDIHSFIKDSHATISASYHEGMSNVLQETAAAGRPIIATDVPGCIETYVPYASGIPFKPRDSQDLVRAIKEFIDLPYEKKAEMGIAGRKRMEQLFDRQIVVDKYMEEIENEV